MKYVWQRPGWPDLTWKSDPLVAPLGKARLAQGRLLSQVKLLGFELNREAQAGILTQEALTTAAIEGEKLDLASIRSSVARRLGLPTAGLPPIERSVDGLVEVLLDATSNCRRSLTQKRIQGWHAALFPTGHSGIHKILAGKWRKSDPMQVVSGPVGREKIHFEAPPSRQVTSEIRRFLLWWEQSRHAMDGLIRAGVAHFHFVTIHPFEDGNGRLARAITDMALAQDEDLPRRFYSLSSQIIEERDAYYAVLERTQRGSGDITEWLLWFVGCFERAMGHAGQVMELTIQKAHFWQNNSATDLSARQRKVINRLLDAGREGFSGGLTTRKYVSLTRVSRATAYRELSDLADKGILVVNQGSGRNSSYSLKYS